MVGRPVQTWIWLGVLAAGAAIWRMSSHSLAVGKAAPEFDLPASDGERYRLSQFRGRAVVICWFPKAHTWG